MIKLFFLILLSFFSTVYGKGKQFTFELQYPEEVLLSEKYRLQGFLKDLEDNISNGVKFSTNQIYKIEIDDFATTKIDCENAKEHIEVTGDHIRFSTALAESIYSFQIERRIKDCILKERIVSDLSNAILSSANAPNLKNWPKSKIGKKNLRTCLREKRRARSLREKRAIEKWEPCVPYFTNYRKQRQMKAYEKKHNKITRGVPFEIDVTSLHNDGFGKFSLCSQDYEATTINRNGTKIKMLGYAFVYYAPGFSTSQFGHVGERFLFCQGDELKSILFEYGPYKDEKDFLFVSKEVYPSFFSDLPENYRKSIEQKNFIRRAIDPTLQNIVTDTHFKGKTDGQIQTRNYGFYQARNNRDMIEIWLKGTEQNRLEAFRAANNSYRKQTENLKNQIDLVSYELFTNNCTHELMDRLSNYTESQYKVNPRIGFNPIWLFEIMKHKNAEKMILYPSQRTMRKLGLLDSGKTLFWENFTLFSRSTQGSKGATSKFVMFYPEFYGPLKRLILYPVTGTINLFGSLIEGIWGLVKAPLKLFNKEKNYRLITAKNNILHSLTEILGVRMRFPAPTQWTEEELFYLKNIVPEQTPKVVPLILKNLNLPKSSGNDD